jgi:hypothetical protein
MPKLIQKIESDMPQNVLRLRVSDNPYIMPSRFLGGDEGRQKSI